jgi:hypothetical protein
MGLDMYLTKRHYVKNWEHSTQKIAVVVRQNADVIEQMYPETKVTLEGGTEIPGLDASKISYVIEDAAYWRKANAVHYWFVNNVQSGTDDCGEYYVDDSKLEELVKLCKEVVRVAKVEVGQVSAGYSFNEAMEKVHHYEEGTVITNPEDVAEILPTESGFFFGSTEYDEYYLEDVKDTIKQLEPLIEKDSDGNYINRADVYYRSSW